MGGQPGQSQMLQGWSQVKGRVQQQWSKLTESDLQQIGGQRGELIQPSGGALRLRPAARPSRKWIASFAR